MPADPSSSFSSSMLFKATILTLAFTSIYYNKTSTFTLFWQHKPNSKQSFTKAPIITQKKIVKKKKTIYLTFDDGPCRGTKTVLTILKNKNVPATFFVIGEHVKGSSLQAAIYDSLKASAYAEIANHSYTHAQHNNYAKYYSIPDTVVKDFNKAADTLQLQSNITRTPGRNIWRTATVTDTDIKASKAAGDSLYKNGYSVVGWDVEWHYNSNQTLLQNEVQMYNDIDSVLTYQKTKTPNHVVLLTHDRTFAKPDDSVKLQKLLEHIIDKNEYNFEIVSNYPQLKKDSIY